MHIQTLPLTQEIFGQVAINYSLMTILVSSQMWNMIIVVWHVIKYAYDIDVYSLKIEVHVT